MASLFGGITNAARALAAHQAALQIASRNLSNANDPAYARQRAELGDRTVLETDLGSQGSGVEALSVQQTRDRLLDASVVREISQTAALSAQQTALEHAQANLGENIDRAGDATSIGDPVNPDSGISSALNDFFNGWEELSANPTDAGARQLLLEKAQVLADKFNTVDQRLGTLQTELATQLTDDTASANSLLKQIAELNGQIAQAEIASPGSAVDLRDQRQSRIESLAKLMDVSTRPLSGSPGQVEIVARTAAGGEFSLVSGTTVRGGLNFTDPQFTSGSPAVPLAISGGSLGGNLAARDGTIQRLRDDLLGTAGQIAGAVNAAYNPGGLSTDFFQVPPASGVMAVSGTVTFTSLRATATANAGANELALAVARVAQQQFSTAGGDLIDGTIGGFFTRTVTGLGQSLASVNSHLGDQETVQRMVTGQRDSVSGVSMDEEMTDLMKFQRAYEASARVVRTMDELLDTLINNFGH